VNIAAVIYSGYKLYWKSITIQLKKQILYKIINCFNIFGKFKLHLKEHDESTRSKKMAVAVADTYGLYMFYMKSCTCWESTMQNNPLSI